MRLRHSNASGRGYRRVAAGTGFSYKDLDGSTLPPGPVRDRLESIGIPPAWTDVWIAPYDNGHIQATGLDAVGRRQYIYHPGWREKKDRLKFDRSLQLAETLPAARRLVTMDLRSEGLTRERVLAAAFRMLDSGSLRVGSERYTNENGSHGLATLLCAHVRRAQGRDSGSVSRPRAARPGSRGSTTPTSPPSCASSSAAVATPGCWPTRTAGAGTR